MQSRRNNFFTPQSRESLSGGIVLSIVSQRCPLLKTHVSMQAKIAAHFKPAMYVVEL
jgi:hypothetical protein